MGKDHKSYLDCGDFDAAIVLFGKEIAGIAVIIVAGFVQQKLPLGFSISCLASNVVIPCIIAFLMSV
jgi:hypothetical protein